MNSDKLKYIDIINIDERIKSFTFENPSIKDKYYVKIWFNYIDNNTIKKYGEQEFISINKNDIISNITNFLNNDNNHIIK